MESDGGTEGIGDGGNKEKGEAGDLGRSGKFLIVSSANPVIARGQTLVTTRLSDAMS